MDGVLGPEASCFLKKVAEQLLFRRNKPYSIVMAWVKMQMQLATIRATNLCLHGFRTKWRIVQRKWTIDVDCQCCSSNAWFLFASLVICYNIIVSLSLYFVVKWEHLVIIVAVCNYQRLYFVWFCLDLCRYPVFFLCCVLSCSCPECSVIVLFVKFCQATKSTR